MCSCYLGLFAWQQEYEAEFEREGLLAQKEAGKRETGAYIPTYFTTQANHDALTASIPASNRPARNTKYQQPLYYETYHKRR